MEFKQYDIFTVLYIAGCALYVGYALGQSIERDRLFENQMETERLNRFRELEGKVEVLTKAAQPAEVNA